MSPTETSDAGLKLFRSHITSRSFTDVNIASCMALIVLLRWISTFYLEERVVYKWVERATIINVS